MKNLFLLVNKFFAFASKLTDFGDRLFPQRSSFETRSRIVGEPDANDKGMTQIY